MKIICKEKDFYDFVGRQAEYGTEDITFDRRDMWVIKSGTVEWDTDTVGVFVNSILSGRYGKVVTEKDIGLWLGNALYIFRISELENRYLPKTADGSFHLNPDFRWKAELLASRKLYNIKHDLPVEFVDIDTNLYTSWGKFHTWKKYEDAKKDRLINEYKEGHPANWEIKPFFEGFKKIPILKNTWVPSFINPHEAYYAIEEWLISQHNDVDQESEGLTDVDKAINHGFDKKASFRNVKD